MGTRTPTLSLPSILENDKLTGLNFLDWQRNLRIVLKQERKLYVHDTPIGDPPPFYTTQSVKDAYDKHTNDSLDVRCLMLATIILDLQKNLMEVEAYEMIETLQDMFQKEARRVYETTQALHTCKMVEGSSVSAHVIKMKGYMDHIRRLGYTLTKEYATDIIPNSLTKDYKEFVINYNMNNMEMTISELHEILKTTEKRVCAGKSVTKSKPVSKVNRSKDDICSYCNEVGHWKRNCQIYLEEKGKN
ncbi:zinc finger, CCHC-type containing protein, partial [Tanacetum coccineum]